MIKFPETKSYYNIKKLYIKLIKDDKSHIYKNKTKIVIHALFLTESRHCVLLTKLNISIIHYSDDL